MKSIAATFFLLGGSLFAQQASKPQISPFFDRLDDGPAFFVECRNNSGETLSSNAIVWRKALRIDGEIVPEPRWGALPGLSGVNIAPGETWRGILALRQSERSFFSGAKFGAMLRSDRLLKISEGKHALAVECGGTWSDEYTFYWEGELRQP